MKPAEPRRLLILLPEGQEHKLRLGPILASFREAPLTHTALAALVPPELGLEIRAVDASVSPVPTDEPFDMVAISLITGTAPRGYELAAHFRARGATVVLGGVHVSLCPDEAAEHADSIVLGFAETSWPALLRDWDAGTLQPRYQAEPAESLAGLPRPRRDLQKPLGYAMPQTVFATRGCAHVCDFCAVPAARFGWRTRPVAEVIDEVRALPRRRFAFNDVNIVQDRDYAMELFEALAPLGKLWGGLATTRIVRDPELLELMARSGCSYLLLGFESIGEGGLAGMRKGFNEPESYHYVCDTLHRHHIAIQGCFIFGLDDDDPGVFSRTVEAVHELRIDIPRYALYTPYPGTPAYARLEAEGRLLERGWRWYDTQHTVIQPAQMSPAALDAGFIRAWRETFTLRSILHRTSACRRQFPISFVGNLAYRMYIRRLARERGRLPAGLATGEGAVT
jgi:radical SAM superfamily enzyme YgiQ (UPF0313 family)